MNITLYACGTEVNGTIKWTYSPLPIPYSMSRVTPGCGMGGIFKHWRDTQPVWRLSFERPFHGGIFPAAGISSGCDACHRYPGGGSRVEPAMEDLTGVAADTIPGKGNYEYAQPFYRERKPILANLVFMKDAEPEQRYNSVVREGEMLIVDIFIRHSGPGKTSLTFLVTGTFICGL